MAALHELVNLAARALANYANAPTITGIMVSPDGLDGPVIAAQLRGHRNDVPADLLNLAHWAELLDRPITLVTHPSHIAISVTTEVGVRQAGEARFRVWDHLDHATAAAILRLAGRRWQQHTPPGRPWAQTQQAELSARDLRAAVFALAAEMTEAA